MSEENAIFEMAGLDLSDDNPEAEAAESTEGVTEETTDEPTEEAKGETKPENEPEDETPASTEDAGKSENPAGFVPVAAVQDERNKRQALEAELEALKQKPAPDPLTDPEGFQAHQMDQITGLKEQFSQQLDEARYEMARLTVMSLKDDYAEVEQVFIEEAKQNPALARMLREAPNPALFAYEQGQKIRQLSQDPEALREQIRAEERAKIEKELSEKSEAAAKTKAAVDNAKKPSLVTAGSSGLDTDAVIDINSVSEMIGEDAVSRKRS